MPVVPFKVVIEPSTVIVFDPPLEEIPFAQLGDIDPVAVTVKLSEPLTVLPPFVAVDALDTIKSSACRGAETATNDDVINNNDLDLMIVSF